MMSSTAVPNYCGKCGRECGFQYFSVGGIILCGLCYADMQPKISININYEIPVVKPFKMPKPTARILQVR